MAPLDRFDSTPLYVQVYRRLRADILDGGYPSDQAIPSEPELQALFRTTRGTVRNAISLLAGDGLVEQVRGKGTFVRFSPIRYSVWNFGGFTDYARNRNVRPVTTVVAKQVVQRDGEQLLRLVRVRGVERDTGRTYLHLDTSLLSLTMFPGLDAYDFAAESLYRVLRDEYDVWPRRNELAITTVAADDETRGLLELDAGVHCLTCVEGSVYDASDTRIEETSIVYSPQASLNIVASI